MAPASSSAAAPALTDQEAKLYDRQLRVWGVEAQHRMRTASVLLAGRVSGAATEVAKNIILAGVGSVTLLDPTPVRPEHLAASFSLHRGDVGRPRDVAIAERLQELNPNVSVSAYRCSSEGYSAGSSAASFTAATAPAAFWRSFDTVILFGASLHDAVTVNNHCRGVSGGTDANSTTTQTFTAAGSSAPQQHQGQEQNGVFRVAPVTWFCYCAFFGDNAFWFQDLGVEYRYLKQIKNVKGVVTDRVPAAATYSPLDAALARLVHAPAFPPVSSASDSDSEADATSSSSSSSIELERKSDCMCSSDDWEGRALRALHAAWPAFARALTGRYRRERGHAALLLTMLCAAAAAHDSDLAAAAALGTAATALAPIATNEHQAGVKDDDKEDAPEQVTVGGAARLRGIETVSDAAVVGGLLAQEVLKSLAGQSEPLQNVAVYNGDENKILVFNL